MSKEFIKKLQYSYEGQQDSSTLPLVLIDSFKLISDFFACNNSNKLCLVFPTKEYAAQWLSLNLALDHLTEEFRGNKQEIFEAYKHYKRGQKLLLNNKAVVEWIKGDEDEIMFKTKGSISKTNPWEDTGGDVITLNTPRIDSLKPAPSSRKVLSARKAVYENLSPKSDYPVDILLNISSKGNFVFLKKPVCLVSKIKNVEFSLGNIYLNKMPLSDFFRTEKIGDSGALITNCPLLIAGNLLHLTLYTIANPVSKIVIDGFSAIQERISDFSDIDAKGIPTILVTDLSEVGNFEQISNFGFDFFNFTKEQFLLEEVAPQSPFYLLNKKLKNYASFKILKEICEHAGLEDLIRKIQSIERDESNNGLSMLKVLLIQLANRISAIVHEMTDEEIVDLNEVLTETEEMFLQNKNWLGDAQVSIRESILLLKSVIDGIRSAPSDKCRRMLFLLKQKRYDYIICPTEREALAVKQFISKQLLAYKPKVISAASIDDSIISESLGCAMLTGWAKSGNVNRLLSSFFFTEITVLFYKFENRYLNSLQKRNQKQSNSIKATIDNKGSCLENGTVERNGFNSFYINNEIIDPPYGGEPDIITFELELDNAQYSRYAVNSSMAESVKAKRADFENDYFIYTTESHKFHVINELIEKQRKRPTLYTKRIDSIVPGDVIALINADRDILANWVEQHTKPEDLSYVNQWIQLWKSLIKDYYASVGNDFKELVLGLRECHCVKHEATIRTWLQDESRIGPDDDADLISIAMLTGSELLHDNINNVRDAISKMKGWRMKASDYIIDRIKDKLHRLTDYTAIGMKFPVENLGSVNILKVTEIQNDWESVDARYANRLLLKETI